MTAFQQAADEADIARDPTSGQLWAQAGNAALAGEQPDKARPYFNAALARGIPDGLEKGEIYLDRARALVALDKLAEARPDIDKALSEVPKDPLAWPFAAILAPRTDNLHVAQDHLATAGAPSPEHASVEIVWAT